jgi:hypothetical protein
VSSNGFHFSNNVKKVIKDNMILQGIHSLFMYFSLDRKFSGFFFFLSIMIIAKKDMLTL